MTENNQIQNHFFSKDTISNLNKLLLQQSSFQNLSRDGKLELINILVKHMKQVYKAMDITKINEENFSSIFDQFKKYSLIESLNEINKTNTLSNLQQSSSELKFARDFNSNPTNGNKLMERPSSTKINSNQFDQPNYLNSTENIYNQDIISNKKNINNLSEDDEKKKNIFS